LIYGSRSGKSLVAPLVAIFLVSFPDYSQILASAEVGTVIVITSDKSQAPSVLGFASRKLKAVRGSQGKLRSHVQLNSGHDLVGHLRHAEINIQGQLTARDHPRKIS